VHRTVRVLIAELLVSRISSSLALCAQRVYECVCVNVCGQHVSDQLALHASAGVSSLCSLLALIGQSQSDLLAIVPAK